MNAHDIATTTAGVVAVAAWAAASVTAWLLVTAPTTVAMAVQARDAQPLARLAFHMLQEAVTRLIQYL
jgi:hypothetical protein